MSVKHSVKHSRRSVKQPVKRVALAYVKDTTRSWLRGWKRFLSIAVISLLGVSVLTGIYAGCRDMFLAADRFYDGQGLHDIQILSTYGLTDDDIVALRRIDGVDTIQPERTQSATTDVAGTDKSVTMTEIGVEGLDLPYLQEGRMPTKAGEVAVTEKYLIDSGHSIGDTITITPADTATSFGVDLSDSGDSDGNATQAGTETNESGDSDERQETATADANKSGDSDANGEPVDDETSPQFPTELIITAQVLDPKDLTNPTGYVTSALRSPTTADYVFFAPSSGVTGNVYTAISLTVEGAAEQDTFGDEYDRIVDEVIDRIEHTVQDDRQQARRQSIVNEAQRQLDDAKADAYAQLDDGQRQIDDQRATLDENRQTLADTRSQLESAQIEIADGETQIATARSQIAAGRLQITQGRQQINEARTQLNAGKQQLADARAQLDAAQQELSNAEQMLQLARQVRDMLDSVPTVDEATWAQIAALLAQLGIDVEPDVPPGDGMQSIKDQLDATIADTQAQYDEGKRQYDANNAVVTQKEQEAAAGEAELNAQASTLEANATALEQQATQLETQAATLATNKQQVEDGLKQVEDGEAQLADGEQQLNDAQAELDEQRAAADEEFAKQQQTIDDIAAARWYVQNRSSIGGYSSLDSDVSSIETLGYAFPVVFLLVAVLMSLTTMTRMVEEERGLIGTYTGLGYGNLTIASRYLLFAVLACLIGGALGLLVGFLGIPSLLLVVLANMYVIPGITLEYDWLYGSLGIALFVVAVLVATAVACAGELRQTPAQLMRPKAPKAGARVLLERIRPLWKRLSFLNKVTARNIFRFKSRLIMTVGGVAGCTALIVCGLGINDSVDALGPKQYEDLYRYDLLVVANDADADAMADLVSGNADVTDTMRVRLESGELANDDGSATIQLMVIPDGGGEDLSEMVELEDAEHGRAALTLADDGVVVAQSAANALGVKAGDTVSLTDGNMRHGEVTVTAVNRGVIGSDVYIGEEAYRQAFGDDSPLTWNAMYALFDGDGDAQVAYAEELQDDPSILTAMSCEDMRRSFRFDLMAAVVALIIGLAGSLALVVLFTLANTNVSERVREMATLKVLGFTDREVHTYVNKEMMILTGVGILVGLPLGRFVCGLLTAALSMPGIYFEVEVRWWSYLIAAAATLVFALLVQLITNPVLDRIDPVSSLKSVE
ncbi:FtsX-like permease family protein [Bifidobacterium pullorum subsp. saeculare]|uniref:FtsX-like permease family protein n=1 Tax=Bifidobacterium pullorum TaxID=78448 RepID=UPI00195A33E9|nr:FtsX-like permease family protein [Bifidobacterium pullorum]MBM6696136.1 FtsX-like permease family protein [Bifidobacterium pullorum subsp. saeculare]